MPLVRSVGGEMCSRSVMKPWKTVIHVHTDFSLDSNASPASVLETAHTERVDCVTITDHDEIDGALEAERLAEGSDVHVVVGEEVSSRDGHIIGLFIRERIPGGLSAEETVLRIRAQGGVVLAPHPFTPLCQHSLRRATARILPWLDGIEIQNAQDPLVWSVPRSRRFARRYGIAPYVGADAHVRGYLAGCYQMMQPFDNANSFRRSLRSAKLFPGMFPAGYFVAMGGRHAWNRVIGTHWRDYGLNVRQRAAITADVG